MNQAVCPFLSSNEFPEPSCQKTVSGNTTKGKTHRYTKLYDCSPGGAEGNNPPTNAGITSHSGLIPGRSPGVGNGNALQYSCLESSMDRGAWGYSSWGYSSWTRLSTAPNLGRALFLLHRFPSPPSLIHPVLHPYSVFFFFSLLCTFSIRQSRTC